VATSSAPRRSRATAAEATLVAVAYGLGALALLGEGVVHLQQYIDLFHDVSWIGPLFLVNLAACLVTIAGIAYPRTRTLAALAGVVISAAVLLSLVISYGTGLFGWQEVGFRAPIVLAASFEVGAVVLLSAALATRAMLVQPRI
jgi:hypothetical protein